MAVSSASAQEESISIPYVDQYGQKTGVSWPGKVLTDADLAAAAANEATRLRSWILPVGIYDRYGGSLTAGWHAMGTGYFRTLERKDVWWLITPDGNPCFYKGLDTAPAEQWETTPVSGREELFAELPAKDGEFAPAWAGDAWGTEPGVSAFAFCTSNLIRKYGPDWRSQFHLVTQQRLHAWGFSGFGKWGDFVPGIPILPVLNRTGVSIAPGGQHPDPFDSATVTSLKTVLAQQMTPHLTDPDVVAWSVGNETAESITSDEIYGLLQDTGAVPAKKALVDYALATLYHGDVGQLALAWNEAGLVPSQTACYDYAFTSVPTADIEALRRYYADEYYEMLEQAVKSIDPNHLYVSSWTVPVYWENDSDWWLNERHCDIVGIDNYGFLPDSAQMSRLITAAGKPVLYGEFAFPQSEPGRGFAEFGELSQQSEQMSGTRYSTYVTAAAEDPCCVGVCWFQYRDQPITGRGPGEGPDYVYGENYPFGLIDIADNPKWTLLDAVRQTNLAVDAKRMLLK